MCVFLSLGSTPILLISVAAKQKPYEKTEQRFLAYVFSKCFWWKCGGPWRGQEYSPGTFLKQNFTFSAYIDDI